MRSMQDWECWNTSQVTDICQSAFESKNNFNQDIGNWNTEKVTDMESMFHYASGVQPRHWELEHVESD